VDGGKGVVEVAQGGGGGSVASNLQELDAELVQGRVEAVATASGGDDDGLGVVGGLRWARRR